MTAITAYIAVGANLSPERNILDGLDRLAAHTELVAVSHFYRTPPLERPEQPDFLNGVCAVRTGMTAEALKFEVLRTIEQAMGRVRSADRHAPRPLDLDILLFGTEVIEGEGITIPDPDIATRPFLFVPLHEIAGDCAIPGLGVTLAHLCATLPTGALRPDEDFSRRVWARFPKAGE